MIPKNFPALPDFPAGEVWLAGAGPGDPRLLTVLALHAIGQADDIVYDALVDRRVLDLRRDGAELISAGKRGGRPSPQQRDINEVLIERARAGRRVLRLKGGDPFVFGRGWDEALALTEAGIRFRIIPGLTAGLAGAALAGIPATSRDTNHAVVLAAGHRAEEGGSAADWAALAKLGQPIVLYMPMSQLAEITASLQQGGLAPDTPAALIQSAATDQEKVVESKLGSLVDDAARHGVGSPLDRRHRRHGGTAAPSCGLAGRLAMTPGFIVAAPHSGAGKTTVTIGLMRALSRQGMAVQAFKCGPDYIDPAFHAAATGRPSFNLDTWAMAPTTLGDLVARHPADIAIAEGVMGLFDGVAAAGQTARGATADLAALLGWPVLLVLDVSGQTETAAAVAAGLAHYRDDVTVAGVILNRVASPRHLALITPGFERVGLKVFGALGHDVRFELPERHLGLVQADETDDIDRRLDALADAIESAVDLAAVRRAAAPAKPWPAVRRGGRPASASLWRAIGRSPSCIPICWRAGGWPARRSFLFRRWPTRRRISGRTSSGCPAAIPSCMAACWPRRAASRTDCTFWRRGRCRSMASAAATWCWGRGSRTPRDGGIPWPGCCRSRPRSPSAGFTSAIVARGFSPTARWDRPARRSWDTNSTMPACCRPVMNRWSTAAMRPVRSCRRPARGAAR